MHILLLTALLFILWIPGCAGSVHPTSNGSMSDLPAVGSTAIVWGQHTGAVGVVVTALQQRGFKIVERSRLQQIFNEQKIRLTYSSDDDAQILQVGKILGADSIVFVETETSSSQTSQAFVNQYGGGSRSETVTNASVSVRGVNVQTSEVMWTGTAFYDRPINNPGAGLIYLAQTALDRGLCLPGAWNDTEGCENAKVHGTGKIGFKFESKNTPEGRQLLVGSVTPDSPADQAGLKVGDILLSCNGKSGLQTRLQYYLACKTDAGQTRTLQVKRGDKITTISATAVLRTEVQK